MTTRELALVSVVAFHVAWLHFWTAVNRGTGREWVMHDPWRFWGPPLLSAVALIAVARAFRRRSEYAAWFSAVRWGALAAVPSWLVALVPADFLCTVGRSIWGIGGGPERWFARHYGGKTLGLGQFAAMMAVVAGPIALVIILLAARRLQRGGMDPTSVSGVSTSAAALTLAAFVVCVLPYLDAKERERTSSPAAARRHEAAERESRNGALLSAAQSGKHDEMHALLQAGVSADVADSLGQTPLIRSAIACDSRAASLLLHWGASISRKDAQGNDAFAHALASRNWRCGGTILALARAGAVPEREALCARILDAVAGESMVVISALAEVAATHGMRDVVAAAHQAATRSGKNATARTLARQYGPLPPPASCATAASSAAP